MSEIKGTSIEAGFYIGRIEYALFYVPKNKPEGFGPYDAISYLEERKVILSSDGKHLDRQLKKISPEEAKKRAGKHSMMRSWIEKQLEEDNNSQK